MAKQNMAATREERATKARRELEASYLKLAGPVQKRALGNLVSRWIETGIPSYMDDAIDYCEVKDLPVTSALRKQLADAARKRRGNRPSKAMREGMQDKAMIVMANLMFVGATLAEAASKAAHWLNSQELGYSLKASSLEKNYTTSYRKGNPSLEDELFSVWRDEPNDAFAQEWENLRMSLPQADDSELGNRRA